MQPVYATDLSVESIGSLPLFGWMLAQVETKATADRARQLGLRVIISKAESATKTALPAKTSAEAEPAAAGVQEDLSFRKPFSDRKMHECSWIVDEPTLDAICCAAPVAKGRSWCPHHTARVLKPAR